MDDFIVSPELTYEMFSYLSSKELISFLSISKDFYALGFELLCKKGIRGDEAARRFIINYLKSCYNSASMEYINPLHVELFLQYLLSNKIGNNERVLAYVIKLYLSLQNKIHLRKNEFHYAFLQLQNAYLNPSTQLIAIWGFYVILSRENPAIKMVFKNSNLWANSLLDAQKFSWFRKEMSLKAITKQFLDQLLLEVNDYQTSSNNRSIINNALSYYLPLLSSKRKKTLLEYAINQFFYKNTIRSSLYRQEIKLNAMLPFMIRYLLLNIEYKTAIKFYREIVNKIARIILKEDAAVYYLKGLYPLYVFCLGQCKDFSKETIESNGKLSELVYNKIQSNEKKSRSYFFLSAKEVELKKKEYFSSADLQKSLRGFYTNKLFFSHEEKLLIASLYFPRVIAKRGSVYSSFIRAYKNYIPDDVIALCYQKELRKITERNYTYYEEIYAIFPFSAKLFCEKLLSLIVEPISLITFQKLFYCAAKYAHFLDEESLNIFAAKMGDYFYQNNQCIEISFLASVPIFDRLIDTFFEYFLQFYQESKLLIKLSYLRHFINIYPVLQRVNQQKIETLLKEIILQSKMRNIDHFELGLALRMANLNVLYAKKQLKTVNRINSQAHSLPSVLDHWMQGDFKPVIKNLEIGFRGPFHTPNDLFYVFLLCQKVAAQYWELPPPIIDLTQCKKIWGSDYRNTITWCECYFTLPLYNEHLISPLIFENSLLQCLLAYQNPKKITQLQEKQSQNLQNFFKKILYQDNKYITVIVLKHFDLLPALFHLENSAQLVLELLKESLADEKDTDQLWYRKKIKQLQYCFLENDAEQLGLLCHSKYSLKERRVSKFSFFMQKIADIPKEFLFINPQSANNIINITF